MVLSVAELYSPGVQRIFYKTSVKDNLVVTAEFLDPSLVTADHYEFIKVPGTIFAYFADVNFYTEGIWIGVFYENGVEKTVQAYNTKKISAEGEFKLGHTGRGPNIIGN